MYDFPDEDKTRIRSGLNVRVTAFAVITVILFSVIFFRLWYLQVLSGDQYLAAANDNRTKTIRLPAPRGEILDRSGRVIVDNRTTLALQAVPQKFPENERRKKAELERLSGIAKIPVKKIRRTLRKEIPVLGQAGPITLQKDIDYDLVYYLKENAKRFPGLQVERVFTRRYPHSTLAAHVVGTVGEVSAEDLKNPQYRALGAGDQIGSGGVEAEYDRYLRGQPGIERIQVDSMGQTKGALSVERPVPGNNLRLTIDSNLQQAGQDALSAQGLPGAFVAMNVDNGEILGIGSNPTYDPTDFSKNYKQLSSEAYDVPLLNRAIQGSYPTGSSFKPITALAGLESGAITATTPVDDPGVVHIGDRDWKNAGDAVNGTIDMTTALKVSSDVYFYKLGAKLEGTLKIQNWANKLGLGKDTGIDLPGEQAGLIPTPKWRNDLYNTFQDGRRVGDRPWSIGDNVNLAIGQGDVQADPLQMALAYATLGNGGRVVRPHVGLQVVDSAGRAVSDIELGPRNQVKIDPGNRSTILGGLHEAAQSPGGTSYKVFGGFPVPVAGKTGTVERPPLPDQSWYVVLAPYPNPKIVVATTFERGGFGVDTAAPAALQILSEYFNKQASSVGSGGGLTE